MPGSVHITRRTFGTLLGAAVALPAAAHTCPPSTMKRPLIKPPRLRQGDLVGLIAPGGRTNDDAIEKAVQRIEALGFRVKQAANLRAVHGNYAGSVQQRIADLHAMFADKEVKALWCIRGGSGCISLLSSIDYALIRANPKILLGYSDITALHLALYRHAGLITFHGPVAMSGPSDYAREHLLAILTEPQARYTIPMALENSRRAIEETHYAMRTATHGQASGRLMGGNLSMVAALAGTPYAADFRNCILYLEEVNEEPYRIDRWMTQLDLAVGFAKAAAVMIGICDNCGPQDESPSLTLDETLDLHLKPLIIPAVSGYSFGHIRHQFTIPVGVKATLDTERQTLTLLEAAVS
jgi:muramoyltetrapeptide carboxypeptidase